MGFTTPQGIICPICKQPVDLTKDRFTNEDGKVVHENCYIRSLLSAGNDPPSPDHAE